MKKPFDWHNITDNYAQVYDEFRGGYAPESIRHILRRAQVNRKTSTILDLACGTGAVFREMTGRSHRLIGMDVAAPMLAESHRLYIPRLPDLRLVCGSGELMPLPGETIDLVTIGQAIHWFNLPVLFAELKRVLRPGGWVAVISRYPSPAGQVHALVERLQYRFSEEGRQGIPHWSRATAPSNLLGIEQAGFVEYERRVIEHEMELTVEGYLRGVLDRSRRRSLPAEDLEGIQAALETVLEKLAQDGVLREPFFDYIVMARKPE